MICDRCKKEDLTLTIFKKEGDNRQWCYDCILKAAEKKESFSLINPCFSNIFNKLS